jgi:hypothetical protein
VNLKVLRDTMELTKLASEVKHLEFIIAEAEYNLRIKELELESLVKKLDGEHNGTD